MLETKNI